MRPWQKLTTQRIRLNRFRTMLKIRYRLPNGQVGDVYLRFTRGAVCALVLTKRRQVVLARQFRPGPGRVLIELPGGGVDAGEAPRRSITREVLEETGYRGRVHFLGKSPVDAWATGWRYHYLIVEAEKIGEPMNEGMEFSEPVLMSLPAFRRHLRRGQLNDVATGYLGLEALRLLAR